jgi:hypothetical protein
MKFNYYWVAVGIAFSNLAVAADFKLDATGGEPLYQTILPKQVYEQSRADELRDLMITNASGEQVPYALFADEELHAQVESNLKSQPLNVHAITESQLNNVDALHVQINQYAENTAVDIQANKANAADKTVYLIDAGDKHPAFKTLRIDWQGGEGKLLAFDVLASHNLKDWYPLGNGVLIKTTSENANLIQNTIEIDGQETSRYLQIRPTGNESIVINKVQAEYLSLRSVERSLHLEKINLVQREQNKEQHVVNVDYEATGRYPAQYLRVELPQMNTMTSARFYARNKTNEPWQYLTTSSLYRTEKAGKVRVNPDVELNHTTARYWRMQFDQANGGLGAQNPTLSLGWRPNTVVWNARGNGPFVLTVGASTSVINRVSAQSLMPDFQVEKISALPKADVGAAIALDAGEAAASVTSKSNAWTSAPDYKTWLLWGGLFLGVLLLAWMAYSLLKADNKK